MYTYLDGEKCSINLYIHIPVVMNLISYILVETVTTNKCIIIFIKLLNSYMVYNMLNQTTVLKSFVPQVWSDTHTY